MMTDTEIYNQKLANLNFRAKLRNVINTNQEVMDAQDNNMVKPILDEEVYKHTAKTNKSTKQQWDILSKQIKTSTTADMNYLQEAAERIAHTVKGRGETS
ncbi:hypothetical protein Cantr_07314 [Candida viswanathii]|uniref:Uncharacterized protein n=1 Tax=Candida viswanathii TaxID=5486 RepID=A0A367XYX1_9ASCO|nr:hypothetical protein Cantr_07314 [Candida viswanathii]